MILKDILENKISTFLIFLSIFITGLILSQDYGISADEEFHRNNGLFYYNYLKVVFSKDTLLINELNSLISQNIKTGDFISSVPSIQPVIFDLIGEFFIDLLNIDGSKNIFQFRHFLNFIFYFLGLCFFYKLILLRFKSNFYSFIGIFFLFLSPRIFAESFYNHKDIFFLSLIIINIFAAYIFLKNPNYKNTFFLSVITALTIDTRIMGLLPFVIIIFILFMRSMNNKIFFKKTIKFILFYLLITSILIIIFWPYLWHNPFVNFLFAVSELSSIKGNLYTLYLGENYHFQNVPWHYYLVWIYISSPLIVTILFSVGFISLIKKFISRFMSLTDDFSNIWKNNIEMFDFFNLLILLLPILFVIERNIGYDAWRQLYYIYPSIILISLFGLNTVILLSKKKIISRILYSLIFLSFINLIIWNYRYHPHQYVYSNILVKGKFFGNFDIDYWGLSNAEALNYIVKNNSVYPINVATKSFASLETSLLMLDSNDKEKIIITHKIEDADFVITNYRNKNKDDFNIDNTKYKKYYEILVKGFAINTIYKKIN